VLLPLLFALEQSDLLRTAEEELASMFQIRPSRARVRERTVRCYARIYTSELKSLLERLGLDLLFSPHK
jgi:hypothetical protein